MPSMPAGAGLWRFLINENYVLFRLDLQLEDFKYLYE